jgi:hypothetical protein
MTATIVIGQTEEILLPEVNTEATHARVDTGAKTSAVWVSRVQVKPQGLEVVFFGKGSPLYTGKPVLFTEYAETVVASSNGSSERRYKVRLLCGIAGKKIRAWFTLADRSKQVYPVLVGRNILRGKFLVDVKLRSSLPDQERERSQVLQGLLNKDQKEQ